MHIKIYYKNVHIRPIPSHLLTFWSWSPLTYYSHVNFPFLLSFINMILFIFAWNLDVNSKVSFLPDGLLGIFWTTPLCTSEKIVIWVFKNITSRNHVFLYNPSWSLQSSSEIFNNVNAWFIFNSLHFTKALWLTITDWIVSPPHKFVCWSTNHQFLWM